MKFNELKLSELMLSTLDNMGFASASEIQKLVIPHALKGKDILGQAQTGTGKTAAFGIPIIENIVEGKDLQSIIIAPSRELASQIFKEIKKLKGDRDIFVMEIIGGVSYTTQIRNIKKNPNIIVATPGRLMDIFDRVPNIDLSTVTSLTLDEADEMLNFGFYKDIKKISKMLPENVQRYFITATFNAKTKKLAKEILNNPIEIKVSEGLNTSDSVEQKYMIVKEKQKLRALTSVLKTNNSRATVVFGRTKRRVDELSEALKRLGYKAIGIQGDMRQRERTRAMEKFRNGDINIIVGTDVIARGIDVSHVDAVINFDVPVDIEYYTHRIGRTGRAKGHGVAYTFVKSSELGYFNQILRETNSSAKEIQMLTDSEVADLRHDETINKTKDFLKKGSKKYKTVSAKIAKEYTKEELSIIVSSLLFDDKISEFDITLTGESSAKGTKKSRSRNKTNDKPSRRKNKNGRKRENRSSKNKRNKK